jgi:hypothetical protein
MPSLQPFQYRVVKEKADLDARLNRLRNFMGSVRFAQVSEAEVQRLKEQEDLMSRLSGVLGRRIESFTEGNPAAIRSLYRTGGPVGAPIDVLTLDSIGDIMSTDLHAAHEVDDGNPVVVAFWGKFSCEGMALAELHVDSLRQYLIAVEPRMEGYAAPAGFVGCVALRKRVPA